MFAFHVAPDGILIAQAPWAVVNAVIQFEVKAIAGIRIGAIALVVGIAGAIVGKKCIDAFIPAAGTDAALSWIDEGFRDKKGQERRRGLIPGLDMQQFEAGPGKAAMRGPTVYRQCL